MIYWEHVRCKSTRASRGTESQDVSCAHRQHDRCQGARESGSGGEEEMWEEKTTKLQRKKQQYCIFTRMHWKTVWIVLQWRETHLSLWWMASSSFIKNGCETTHISVLWAAVFIINWCFLLWHMSECSHCLICPPWWSHSPQRCIFKPCCQHVNSWMSHSGWGVLSERKRNTFRLFWSDLKAAGTGFQLN